MPATSSGERWASHPALLRRIIDFGCVQIRSPVVPADHIDLVVDHSAVRYRPLLHELGGTLPGVCDWVVALDQFYRMFTVVPTDCPQTTALLSKTNTDRLSQGILRRSIAKRGAQIGKGEPQRPIFETKY